MIMYELFGIEVPNWVIIVAVVLLVILASIPKLRKMNKEAWRKVIEEIEEEEKFTILSDGTKVESDDDSLSASSSLPFDGNVFATYFANEMIMRLELKPDEWFGDWFSEVIEYYLFKWQAEGLVEINVDDTDNPIIFSGWQQPREEVELELFEIMKSAGIDVSKDSVCDQYTQWGKKIAQIGADELLQSDIIAKDSKGTMRFTPAGYDQAVKIKSFSKYIEEINFSHEFQLLDEQTQKQQLGMALLIGASENIENYVVENEPTCGLIKLADDIVDIVLEWGIGS